MIRGILLVITNVIFVSLGLTYPGALGAEPRQAPCENTPTSRNCWGNYSIDTNYEETWPNTGVTREYWLVAEKTMVAPDGLKLERMVFNGSMPGPTIEADWGDEVVIHVTNNIPDNGTAVHWHGIRQLNTSYQDGVPGITQCPIAPGQTQTYKFRASQYGSSWYHSHFTLQNAQGLIGPIVIHGPTTANYDVDLGPVLIQEWYHGDIWEIWAESQRIIALEQPAAENGLINGKNPTNCTPSAVTPQCVGNATRWEVQFEPGKRYLFRVVGVQADGYMKFTIDGHLLQVVAADFVPIEPYMTDNIIVVSGQRYDVIVEANHTAGGSFWMRAVYMTACNLNDNDAKNNIRAIVRYAGADNATDPTSTINAGATDACGDEPYQSLTPWVKQDAGESAEREFIRLGWFYQLDLVFHWTLHDGQYLQADWSKPTLMGLQQGQTNFTALDNVYVSNVTASKFLYLVIEDLTAVNTYHPMHLHGHDFYILGQGKYANPNLENVTLNTRNPPRRDTASLYGTGYLIIAIKMDNPGAWLLHCHIAWHASQGLAMQLIERPSDIPSMMADDMSSLQGTCASWQSYYETAKPVQDDSGI